MRSPLGKFITIDGPNGVGKTTIANEVVARLESNGYSASVTAEPSNGPLGALLRSHSDEYRDEALACLVAADRYDHLAKEVLPSLAAGKTVVSARYVESSLVLQRLDGLSLDFIWRLNSGVRVPDLSIILAASGETLRQRLSGRTALQRHEREYTAEDESKFYDEAASFLGNRGFNFMTITSDESGPSETVERILAAMSSLGFALSSTQA